jgi:hypothetical protein
MVRNHSTVELAFLRPESGGFTALMTALTEETASLATRRKAVTLLHYFWKKGHRVALPPDSALLKARTRCALAAAATRS